MEPTSATGAHPRVTNAGAAAGGRGHGFGTAPVFLASISTILGAVMFLRFGYAVAHTGFVGTILVVLIGHLVTVPTALAIAEIATNRRVEGGGEYYIISRSFGVTIGGAIGVSLFLSQAISVAFYMIAFAEAFRPLAPWIEGWLGVFRPGLAFDPRMVSLPAMVGLLLLVVARGANLGVKALWVVVAILGLSLVAFFLGGPPEGTAIDTVHLTSPLDRPDPFFLVFAIVFPAFTGMTAGVGLSGDLANPRRSIPLGMIMATVTGLLIYVALAWKLAASASPEMLADEDTMVMQRIAIWGPIVPIGLACATISSAIGSILVAPRTLQALAADQVIPATGANRFLSRGVGAGNDPRNATLVTGLLAIGVVATGNVDVVAQLISMFFMLTYGALCLISFLEHFAARPSYRPSFRSKWYISLLGAVLSLLMMFQMNPGYAVLSILVMIGLYVGIRSGRQQKGDDLAAIFHGVMTQLTRYMQIRLQKALAGRSDGDWRPSVIMINPRTFDRSAPLQVLTWLCHRYGFGTYLHLINGRLTDETWAESRAVLPRLIQNVRSRRSAIYVDTMISPSLHSALAQSLQIPGVSGMDNNTALFEFSVHDPEQVIDEVIEGARMAATACMSGLVLRHGDQYFGNQRSIHVWLTWHDYRNANLMILLAYITLGHPDWKDGEISIFAVFPEAETEQQTEKLSGMIAEGRIPISPKNIRMIPTDDRTDFDRLVSERSADADLVVLGYTVPRLESKRGELLRRHPTLTDVLFVCAEQRVEIE